MSGKRVLLTGATGGLGRAIAERLAGSGATIVLSSRKADELTALASSLPGEGHKAVVADLASEGSAERLVADSGDVDILVANAGLPGTGKIQNFSEQEIARAVAVNLEAPMRMARLLVPKMLERGEGHLVFVSSLSGKAPSPSSSVYNATKFGLRGFAFGLRCDLAGTGVGVSVVSPGFVRDAGMFADAGMKAPGGMGTIAPQAVADGVLRAISRDKAEIAVATRRLRTMSHLGLANPSMAIRVASGSAGQKAAAKLTDQQTDKR